jgi:MerR family transcriptional regulator, light-induced transcriptional regulator
MYTIKQAAARAGVSVPVLRAWERRYGVVAPARTRSGYRLYDDAEIARVEAMRRLVGAGWLPSEAARVVIQQGPGAAGPVPGAQSDASGGDPDRAVAAVDAVAGAPPPPPRQVLRDRFIDAAAGLDDRALGQVLDEMFAVGTFETVASALLFPALRGVGDAWASGRLGVDAEHLASHAVLRRLSGALEASAPGPGRERPVLVGLPPGSRHELGALAFAVVARRAGLPVSYLGPDLPIADWVAAARDARAAIIGVVTPADIVAATELVDHLRAAHPGLPVAVGGGSAGGVRGAEHLPEDLPAAVATLSGRIGDGPAVVDG